MSQRVKTLHICNARLQTCNEHVHQSLYGQNLLELRIALEGV